MKSLALTVKILYARIKYICVFSRFLKNLIYFRAKPNPLLPSGPFAQLEGASPPSFFKVANNLPFTRPRFELFLCVSYISINM